jgi:histidinol-phosphate aminotransferase
MKTVRPSPLAMQAITKALPDIYLYPDGNCYELKRVWLLLSNPCQPIIIGNGSDELLKLIAEAFICRMMKSSSPSLRFRNMNLYH